MNKKNSAYSILISLFLFLYLSLAVNAEPMKTDVGNSYQNNITIAVLPFANYSENSQVLATVTKLVYHELDKLQLNYINQTSLRTILRKHRIRTIGKISKQDVKYLMESTNVQKVILGEINIYGAKLNPEISISMRIIDTKNMSVLSARTNSVTGQDYEKLFGLGKIESIDLLLKKVVSELCVNLFDDMLLKDASKLTQQSFPTVALIPMDNLSSYKNAGLISTNILLTTLVNSNFNVIEPGVINKIMLKNRRILRGEIDLLTLDIINNELDIDLIITGSIDNFQLASGSRLPEIELGLRTLDASDGEIINMFNDNKKGDDTQSFFGHGRIHAIGELMATSFNEYIHILVKKSENYDEKRN